MTNLPAEFHRNSAETALPQGPIHFGHALQNKRIVHVSEVPRGRACGCVCARCNQEVIAKKGSQRQHHFAHVGESHCDGGVETLLHRLAKEIISHADGIRLPAYQFTKRLAFPRDPPLTLTRLLAPEIFARFDRCEVEKPLGEIKPDILLEHRGEPLIIEIAVFHPADRTKRQALRRVNLPALEIRLKPHDIQLDRTALARKLLQTREGKIWLFHPMQRLAERDWFCALRQSVRERREAAAAERALSMRIAHSTAAAHVPGLSSECSQSGPLPAPGTREWREENTWAERFYRQNGRYPSLAETLAYRARC